MNMKKMIVTAKVTSVMVCLCLCSLIAFNAKEAETSTVFMSDDQIEESNENECIEAYQTENSTVMDAYLHEVHYIDER